MFRLYDIVRYQRNGGNAVPRRILFVDKRETKIFYTGTVFSYGLLLDLYDNPCIQL